MVFEFSPLLARSWRGLFRRRVHMHAASLVADYTQRPTLMLCGTICQASSLTWRWGVSPHVAMIRRITNFCNFFMSVAGPHDQVAEESALKTGEFKCTSEHSWKELQVAKRCQANAQRCDRGDDGGDATTST